MNERFHFRHIFTPAAVVFAALFLAAAAVNAADKTVATYERFEAAFESATAYSNPVQEASLIAAFTSPQGEKFTVPGFWDGGKNWRARFLPTRPGKWKFETTCSDKANKGLHGQTGEFTANVALTNTPLARHGPIRVANDGRYFEHADGTPFFWLGDTAWNGALLSTGPEWEQYIKERTRQRFSVVQFVTTQWRASPEGDVNKQTAFTGSDRITINPAFFQRLDEKVDALNKAGLVAAPVLLWAIAGGGNSKVNPGNSLPDDQAALLARYMVARWSGSAVAYLLAGDADYRGEKSEKWKKIGRAVFNDIAHGPVSMHPGGMQWVWKEFIDEKWYNFVGYQSGHGDNTNTLEWMISGPSTEDWMKLPHKPFVNLEPPYENHLAYHSKKPHTPESVRRAVYWSLLNTPTAGVTYGGHGVWGWDDGTKAPTDHAGTGTPLPWKQALTMPGAEQMALLHDFFDSIEWWKLRPAPAVIRNNPGAGAPAKYFAAAKSDDRNLCVVYVPEDRTVEVLMSLIPSSPVVSWFNPRRIETNTINAVGVVTSDTIQFPTPDVGDWLLLLKMDKKEEPPAAEKPKGTAK
ncbi:MAG TPA: DUF4038 domain-containing protein [Verrucomicrobiae bacterium]|nr:DUF4038 domain-containing protein [Verrucomicrobiae bacterium]